MIWFGAVPSNFSIPPELPVSSAAAFRGCMFDMAYTGTGSLTLLTADIMASSQ